MRSISLAVADFWQYIQNLNSIFLELRLVKNHLQVLGTKTKIYIAMEYASGGQLSDKMVRLT